MAIGHLRTTSAHTAPSVAAAVANIRLRSRARADSLPRKQLQSFNRVVQLYACRGHFACTRADSGAGATMDDMDYVQEERNVEEVRY